MAQQDRPPIPAVPRATLRVQLAPDFGFAALAEQAPYLAALGVSHVYASPFLKARPGSAHGYDIVDHGAFNPEIGDEAAFAALTDRLHRHGLGLILDFVPNHMGVGGADNPWWLDVLEWGRDSPYAPFFDIDWDGGVDGRLLLPVLGDQYGAVLERGELQLKLEAGAFSVWYWQHRFPIAPRCYPSLLREVVSGLEGEDADALAALAGDFAALDAPGQDLTRQSAIRRGAEDLKLRLDRLLAERPAVAAKLGDAIARLNGTAGAPDSFVDLHGLLERQSYRVAFWRVAADEINYRRFFDINELAGLRIERSEPFELSHRLVFRLIGEGRLQGLRIDHIDGLYDPKAYAEAVQARAAYLADQAAALGPAPAPGAPRLPQPLYMVVEKILAAEERLRADWPVAGTTGYEFMVLVNGLFVDPAAERSLTDIYERFIGRAAPYAEMRLAAKRLIVWRNLSAELGVLARELQSLARRSWTTRDHTLTGLRRALAEVVAHFPVYRTYVTGTQATAIQATAADRLEIDRAVGAAKEDAEAATDLSVYDFIRDVLTTDILRGRGGDAYPAEEVVRIAMKAQQYTGPVMAKSVEDTLFYRYLRLVSLNEVGGDPDRFGIDPTLFHAANIERQRHWPHQLVTVATHDHKRGAETRVRLDVLSEVPEAWGAAVARWSSLTRPLTTRQNGRTAPGRNDEYLLYQTLVGAWPLDLAPNDREGLESFRDRIAGYMLKAVRESKVRSHWSAPATDYETALERFVADVLDPERSAEFLADLHGFVARIATAGAANGLAQALLLATVPGVPDIYQGTEFWDFSLVDPDNRRLPDWPARADALADAADPVALLAHWRDGRIKQAVLARALALRRELPALFADGAYVPVEATGPQAHRVVAFLRRHGDTGYLTVVPRLVAGLLPEGIDRPLVPGAAWEGTGLVLPDLAGFAAADLLTGEGIALDSAGPPLPVGMLLARFPVALLRLVPTAEPGPAG